MSYKIVRFYSRPGRNAGGHLESKKRTIERGLSLLEVQEHCNDPSTEGTLPKSRGGWDWFDGYYEE